jgi:glycosyltransferase involved in cell wall biosynthesis
MSDVSVLMTVYNGMPYLQLAVESVLAQTLQDFQFVIVNDGSTDGTTEYLTSLTDPRITVLQQANQGTAAAANHGLAHVDSAFVARMDADDVTLATRLERQRNYLLANPHVGLVGTQVVPLGSSRAGSSLQLPLTHAEIYPAMLSGRHGLAHSSIMLRTDLLREIGGYWSLNLVDDWDMMLRMGEVAELANLPEVLHHYRVHEGSLNGSGMRRMRFSIDYACELARRRQTGRPPISPDDFAANRNSRPWWQRANESLELHARTQYRLAVAELHGRRRLIGAARLAWAALCSPQLTLERLARVFRKETQLRKEART